MLRGVADRCLLLDGGGGMPHAWRGGSLVAVRSRALRQFGTDRRGEALGTLERAVQRRRQPGATADTGVLAVVSYELGAPTRTSAPDGAPGLALVEVDASLRFPLDGPPRLTVRAPARLGEQIGPVAAALSARLPQEPDVVEAARRRARTSLPRELYLQRVRRVQDRIRAGDVYQANLTQSFTVDLGAEEPLTVYRRLVARTPAPRSALIEGDGWQLLSASPETFLTLDPQGRIETRPIKGTRPRRVGEALDRAAAAELASSDKDRAELIMITDLERNDLGRVCLPGSVQVPVLVGLESFPAVHHLVSRVVGRLRPGVGAAELIEATFPGGSISGAPKIRAMEILRELEPVDRGFYTGSLAWFGDDGSMESSILIRSIVMQGGRARLGAGGGIVADSDPEAEWRESNHKARALAEVLGFEPEEAR